MIAMLHGTPALLPRRVLLDCPLAQMGCSTCCKSSHTCVWCDSDLQFTIFLFWRVASHATQTPACCFLSLQLCSYLSIGCMGVTWGGWSRDLAPDLFEVSSFSNSPSDLGSFQRMFLSSKQIVGQWHLIQAKPMIHESMMPCKCCWWHCYKWICREVNRKLGR